MFPKVILVVLKRQFYINFISFSNNANPVILTIHFVRVKAAVIWQLFEKYTNIYTELPLYQYWFSGALLVGLNIGKK